jgi:hypothetical protein
MQLLYSFKPLHMAKAKKTLTEKQFEERRKKDAERKRRQRERDAKEKKKQEAIKASKRKSFRKTQIEKRNEIWEAYLRDCYGK